MNFKQFIELAAKVGRYGDSDEQTFVECVAGDQSFAVFTNYTALYNHLVRRKKTEAEIRAATNVYVDYIRWTVYGDDQQGDDYGL